MKWLLIIVLIVGIATVVGGAGALIQAMTTSPSRGFFESDASYAKKLVVHSRDKVFLAKVLAVGVVIAAVPAAALFL